MLLSCVWLWFAQSAASSEKIAGAEQSYLPQHMSPNFAFSRTWDVLGPFQIGTREAPWGADPLEYHGGFRSLEYKVDTTFRSSLANNGTASWSSHEAELSAEGNDHVSANLNVGFHDVDWDFLHRVYGWAAFQWQGWARGEILVTSKDASAMVLHTEGILEYWIDDVHYFGGDFYGFRRAPVTLRLGPGTHRIDIRLIRDVRASGGIGAPTLDVKLELQRSYGGLRPLFGVIDKDVMMADVVGGDFGPLASSYASVTVRNDGETDIFVHGIEGMADVCKLELLAGSPMRLVSGQTRPIGFRVACVPSYNRRIELDLQYQIEGYTDLRSLHLSHWPRVLNSMNEPHRITFLHPGGMVSYAILRPPSQNACKRYNKRSLPVLLVLHGAGVEADDDMIKHAMDPLADLCAWVLFPTGATPWCGDDWHQWGLADVEAAVKAIHQWIDEVEWNGPGVDIDKWIVSGHSNGGQGAWYTLTHRPDKVIAAVPLSGYSSIQNYVPYSFWHTADPGRTAVVQSSLLSYQHELLLENVKDIRVLQQHGNQDDNVPIYHSRLLNQRIKEAGADSTYFEMDGKPHWWDGVLTTEPLAEFFQKQVELALKQSDPHLDWQNFSVVSANPGDTGSKKGVEITALITPGRLGRLDVTFDIGLRACLISSTNMNEFRLPSRFGECSYIAVDGQRVHVSQVATTGARFEKASNGWQASNMNDLVKVTSSERRGRQLGAMDAVLRTHGIFQIVRHSPETARIALQISRNLNQYLAADADVIADYEKALASSGNVISVAVGSRYPKSFGSTGDHPFHIDAEAVTINDRGVLRSYDTRRGLGLAAIFLRPLPNERLELVVWAADEPSLAIAARLVPMMTGSGQPDFVVADRSMLWKGLEGTIALGFFESCKLGWNVSRNSYLT